MSDNLKIIVNAFAAAAFLLIFYFVVASAVSGWRFAQVQFSNYWYFIVSLASGFGIQVGLYTYLKQEVKKSNERISGKALAVTGTTSTFAMVSCCAHYLANILPILGIAGMLTVISQYQIQLFWAGLISNAIGIIYIVYSIIYFKKRLWNQRIL